MSEHISRPFDDAAIIFREGEPGGEAFLVEAGRVELIKETGSGPMRLALLGEGELFGEINLIEEGAVRDSTAVARGAVTVRPIRRQDFLGLLSERPETSLDLLRAAVGRVKGADAGLARAAQQASSDQSSLWKMLRIPAEALNAELRLQFQPDAVEIEERPIPRAARAVLWTIIAFLVSGVIWGSVAKIDRLVQAEGKVVTTAPKIVMQPIETSIIRSLNVQAGQIVQAGDLLVGLDPTFSAADERSTRVSLTSSVAEIKRLEAELTGTENGVFSDDPEEQRIQADLFMKRARERASQMKSFDSEIAEMEAKEKALRTDRANLENQRRIAEEMEGMRSKLQSEGYGSKVALLDSRNQLAGVRREIDRVTNEQIEITHRIAATQAKRDSYTDDWRSKAAEQMQTARKEVNRLTGVAQKQGRVAGMIEMRAPSKAKVLEMASRSVGSVVREAEPLVTLVALDVPMEIEAAIPPRDISQVRAGDAVRIKLEAFPFQKHGTIEGSVASVGGDIVEEEIEGHKMRVYKVRVAITKNTLREVPKDFELLPGMAATCEIKVGSRRLITYLLYPVLRTLESGMREP